MARFHAIRRVNYRDAVLPRRFRIFYRSDLLGIYLYGWNRVPPRAHLFAGAIVAISGAVSGIFVVIANAWMNTPTGFRIVDNKPVDIDPLAAMMNPAAFGQTLHMTLAAYAATGLLSPAYMRSCFAAIETIVFIRAR